MDSPAIVQTPSQDERVLREQLRLVLASFKNGALFTIFNVLLVNWAVDTAQNYRAMWAWSALALASKFFSTWDARRQLARETSLSPLQPLVRRLMVLNFLDGMIWGMLTWPTLGTGSLAVNVFVFAIIAGGVVGKVMAHLSPLVPVVMAFIIGMLITTGGRLLTLDDPVFHILALAAVLYDIILYRQAVSNSRAARETIQMRFENLEMLQQLRVEKEIAAAAQREAEEANAAKSKFLAAASHDLRQPVHAQGLFLEVLAATRLDEAQQELVANIRAASAASGEMLNTLLDFSRIEAGVLHPRPGPLPIRVLINKIEQELGPQADAKGIVYRSRESRLAIESDPALLELILRNLVSNAIRYTDRGGLLVACRRRGSQALLEVWDTGIGIEPAQQREIFREFHQLGNPERDRRKGLGLGLAITDGLARLLGHRLSLASRPGRGSMFRLELPLAESSAGLPASSCDETVPLQPLHLRVLVIDDDEAVRVAMQRLIESWACECRVCESIEEAMATVAQWTPQLVISDYRLRENKTGADAIAALRARHGETLPALLITGDTAPDRLRDAESLGVPLLHKPVAPAQLYRAITELSSTPGH